MGSLIQLKELQAQRDAPASMLASQKLPTSPVIEQLRHRLISGSCADSVEVKLAIVGELLYHCYQELMKRRYL